MVVKIAALALGAVLLAAPIRPVGPTRDELLRCYFITHPAPPVRAGAFETERNHGRFV